MSFIAEAKEALAEKIFADVKDELGKSEQSALDAKKKFERALKSNDVDDTESARKNLKAIESRLRDYDVQARTVEGEIFSLREEADKVRKAVDEFERSFDESLYRKSEEHARMAMEKLMSYDTEIPLVAKHVEAKKKEVDKALQEFDIEAHSVSFSGKSIVFEREEAGKVKAMPEFSELNSSWEKYKTDRTDGALSHIADLVQKMPQKIRDSYWELLSAFETEQREAADRAKIRISLKSFLCYAIAVAGLVAFAPYWQGWEWKGLKGAAAAFMFIVPAIAVTIVPGGDSTDEHPNPSYEFFLMLVLFYWGAAFITLTLLSWNSYSNNWQTWGGIAVLILGIVGGIENLKSVKKKAADKARKAAGYLSEFEKLSSQSEEYRTFKATHKK